LVVIPAPPVAVLAPALPPPAPEEPSEPPPFVVIPAPPVAVLAPAPPPPVPETTHLLFAGLESGVLGAVLMMVWFALDALVERQHWWAMLNLWGAAIYGNAVFRMSLGKASLAGAALHIFLGGVAGAVIALALGRLHRFSLILLGAMVAGVVWYGILQHGILRSLNPLIVRMTPQPATLLAHLLYAAVLTRIPGRGISLAAAWGREPD
jgi:hypothetical protein